jgi:hypothetical protein
MAPDTSGVWIAWTKKSGFSRNRFFQTYVSTNIAVVFVAQTQQQIQAGFSCKINE